MNADLIRRLADAGCSAEQVALAAQFQERRPECSDFIDAILDGLESSGRITEAPSYVETLCTKLLERTKPKRREVREPGDTGYACGPKERWGYEGPITARLLERDWWPLRNFILRRDNYTCHYCGTRDDRMCADHVVPLSRGGTNDPDNLVACCLPCNSSKSDRLLSEWKGRYQ